MWFQPTWLKSSTYALPACSLCPTITCWMVSGASFMHALHRPGRLWPTLLCSWPVLVVLWSMPLNQSIALIWFISGYYGQCKPLNDNQDKQNPLSWTQFPYNLAPRTKKSNGKKCNLMHAVIAGLVIYRVTEKLPERKDVRVDIFFTSIIFRSNCKINADKGFALHSWKRQKVPQ